MTNHTISSLGQGMRRPIRHASPFTLRNHRAYRSDRKLPDDTVCPDCHASVHDGRWQWLEAGPNAAEARCPACRRIRDDFPAGFLFIEGAFFEKHRVELMNMVQTHAKRAVAEHPLRRLMATADIPGGVLVTTTDTHLAREIGSALHEAYDGAVDFAYESDQEMVRVHWVR